MCGVFTEFSNVWQDRRLPMYSNTNISVSVTCAVKWPEGINLATLSCKAEMKYLLYTLQINKYCLSVLQSSMFDFDWSDSVMLCSLVCLTQRHCILVVLIVGPIPNIFGFSFFYTTLSTPIYKIFDLATVCQIWIIFTHLKLGIASARHNFKWVKIPIK